MLKKIKEYIKNHIDTKLEKPILTGKPHVLVGLSGGPDSVFLFHVLKSFEEEGLIKLSAAHLNHGWRPEAVEEALFCKKLCERHDVAIFVEHIKDSEFKIKFNGSKEEVGRFYRRRFFERVREQNDVDYVALAHHLQDQQETFFIRMIRGCSLAGLTAIKPVQGFYIRPLLKVAKSEILRYLEDNGIEYVTDASNESDDYLRNRIRKYVMPALSQADERFDQKFQTTLDTLEQEERLLKGVADQAYERVFEGSRGCKEAFGALDSVLQKRVLVKWLCEQDVKFCPSTRFLDEIVRFVVSDRGGAHNIHLDWQIRKKSGKFWIEKLVK